MSRGFRDEDVTQAMTDKAMAETINKVLEQEARSGDRRAHGEAGMCDECGRPIGAERLAALPSAIRCVRCQSAWEQTNR